MSEEVAEEPLAAIEESKGDIVLEAVKEVETQDILVCGRCHEVYHHIEEFGVHKSKDDCKENGELKETLKDEKKPQIWAFTLWKNTKFKDAKEEEDKAPTSWSLYQLWKNLDAKQKDVWLEAGERVQALYEIVCKFENVKSVRNRGVKSEETVENEEEGGAGSKKDPLGMDNESSRDPTDGTEKVGAKKTILKPVQLNDKVAIISRKPRMMTRKAVRTGSDPKVEHVVEKIVSKRYNPRRRTFEYLLKWENFESEKNTWEPVANLINCKTMLEEFEKSWQIQKEQQRLQKMLEKKAANQKKQELLQYSEGRPQRTSKQKALNQVKQWCGNIEADENSSGKRLFSDDSDDEEFEKRMKYEEYSSDSENESPVVTIKRIAKSQNGVEKKKIEAVALPDNILIPDAKGIVRINQKQIPALSSGVYVMSKTAGIIKLDTKATRMATSGGQTVLKVAPKIGQTSIKVIKKDITNGTTIASKTANILRAKPQVIRNYSGRVYMQKKATNAQTTTMVKKPIVVAESVKEEPKEEDDDSDGIEELEFPTDDVPIPTADSPPPFTLCPLTGKVLGKDGKEVEDPPFVPIKDEAAETSNENAAAAIDNLVNMAAADILEGMEDADVKKEEVQKKEQENLEEPSSADAKMEEEAETSGKASDKEAEKDEKEDEEDSLKAEETAEATPETQTPIESAQTTEEKPGPVSSAPNSILSTALTNANISVKRQTPTLVHRTQPKQILNRSFGARPAPQAIITRITPGTSPIQRSRVMAPKPKESIVRRRIVAPASVGNRSLVRRVGDTKIYTPAGAVQSQAGSYVVTPSKTSMVISMPSLLDSESAEKTETESTVVLKPEVKADESTAVPTTSVQSAVNLSNLSAGDSETPLLITGEDGTIYQVAGQNEDGQTILITQGEDGEQHCILIASESAGVVNQALTKPVEQPEPEPEQPVQIETPPVEEPMATSENEDAADDSQVVAQIVSANPPSPGGTRKVVLMLPDGNFMMTEVTAEQYAALELDK